MDGVQPLQPPARRATSSDAPRRRCFRYGNYSGYYGYRVGKTQEDHRLLALQAAWFAGRRCLDVGCNEGLVPLTLAVKYHTASFTGVDIDSSLVARAQSKLRRLQAAAECASSSSGTPATADAAELAAAVPALAGCAFRQANFLRLELAPGSLDTVLCLSVSKWVHLNWGDEGLTTLFARAFAVLAPGGVFILEPQPWKSYKAAFKKQRMPADTLATYRSLALRPAGFAELLVGTTGFEKVEELRQAAGSGFDRPLLCAYKKAADE